MIEVEKPPRPIPGWLAMLVIAAGIAGAGWFVWATFIDTRPRERVVVLDKSADEGVQQRGDKRWQVRGGNAWLGVEKDATGTIAFEFRFWRYDFLPPDTMDTLAKVQRIDRDAAMAGQLGVTPQQLGRLREIRSQGRVELPPRRRRTPARPVAGVRIGDELEGEAIGGGEAGPGGRRDRARPGGGFRADGRRARRAGEAGAEAGTVAAV